MSRNWRNAAVTALLTAALSAGTVLTGCTAFEGPALSNTSAEPGTTAKPEVTTGAPETNAPEVESTFALSFADDYTATAEVKKEREIVVTRPSDRVVITANGAFSVQVGDADPIASVDGKVSIDNTAVVQNGMTVQVTVSFELTLTFTLDFDLGAEENPYVAGEDGAIKIPAAKSAFFKVAQSGWYTLSGENFALTNYALSSDGLIYLSAGTYGISATGEGAQFGEVTVTAATAPNGYSAESPVQIDRLDTEKVVSLFSGVKLYYSFTATEDGVYVVSLGGDKGGNCKFTVSTDDNKTAYGKYYEDGRFLTCNGGETCLVYLKANESVVVTVDYTLSDYFFGNATVSAKVSKATPTAIEKQTDDSIYGSGTLTAGGKLVFSFTAPDDGVYTLNFGMKNAGKKAWFYTSETPSQLISDADGYDDAAYVHVKKDDVIYVVVGGFALADAGDVQIMVNVATSEPLPKDGWAASGTYTDVNESYTLILDNDKLMVKWNDFDAVSFTYLNGEATFTVSTDYGSTDYKFCVVDNALEVYYWRSSRNEWKKQTTVSYVEGVDPVAIEKWAGVYQTADGDELTIFSDGSAIMGLKKLNGSYSTIRNILTLNYTYKLEIVEMKDSKVYKIKMTNGDETATYTVTDAEVPNLPAKLPIANGNEYKGSNGYEVKSSDYGYQTVNSASFSIIGLTDNGYVIGGYDAEFELTKYVLVFEGTANDPTSIKIYDKDNRLLDTLTKFVAVPAGLVVGENKGENANSDSEYSYFIIKESGWYTFTNSEDYPIYTGATIQNGKPYLDYWTCGEFNVGASGTTKYLEKDAIIAISMGHKITVSACSATAPAGLSESNPFAMTGSTVDLTNQLSGTDVFYVSFTASAAGTYTISFDNELVHFVVNGKDYGKYYDENSGWWGAYVEYANGLTCTVELAANDLVVIAVNRASASDTEDVKITVAPKQSEGGSGSGSETDTPVLPAGTYEYEDDYMSVTLIVSADGKITYIVDGDTSVSDATYTVSDGKFKFSCDFFGVPSDVTLTVNEDGSIKLEDTFDCVLTKKSDSIVGAWTGTDKNNNVYKLVVNENGTVDYYQGPALDELESLGTGVAYTEANGSYQFSITDFMGTLTYTFVLNSDGTITLSDSDDNSVKLTKSGETSSNPGSGIFSEGQIGTYTYCDDSDEENPKYYTLYLDSNDATFYGAGYEIENATITDGGNNYTFYGDGVTFSFYFSYNPNESVKAVNLTISASGSDTVDLTLKPYV